MKRFEIVPHVADVRIKLEADNLQDLFETALEGMDEILKKGFCKRLMKNLLKLELDISSPDITSLLIDLLSDILTLSHIHSTIFCKVVFKEFATNSLKAIIYGGKVRRFDEDIKAVSYHEAEVIKNKNGNFQTNIIFDI